MLRGRRPPKEVQFELLMWGIILITCAVIYVTLWDVMPYLLLILPGFFLLGSAIYQDLQEGWHAGWWSYMLAILVIATGIAWMVNELTGETRLPWWIVALVELGIVFVVKAFYDPDYAVPEE